MLFCFGKGVKTDEYMNSISVCLQVFGEFFNSFFSDETAITFTYLGEFVVESEIVIAEAIPES